MSRELHVIFGSGPVGLATARALRQRGRTVRLVNRSGAAPAPDGTELVAADALDPDQAAAATAGAAVVYQCAQPRYTRWPQDFPPLQRAVLEAAAAAGAKLVIADNLYMYGRVSGPIHEGLPHAAISRKGRVRAAMAAAALAAHREGRLPVAIARASDFFGSFVTDSALGERVFGPLLRGGRAQVLGDPDQLHSYTYIDDFGETLATLGERSEADGEVWHAPNAPALSTRAVVEAAFALTGHPPRIAAMGRAMLRIGGLFIPEAREMIEMMYEFEEPFVVDDSKVRRVFGLSETPLERALGRTLAWYRQHAGERS